MTIKWSQLGVNSLIYGAVLGGALILVSALTYLFNANLFSFAFIAFNFILLIGLPLTAALLGTTRYRKLYADEKRINFLIALISCLCIILIAFIFSGLYSYIFNALIDPGYMTQQKEKLVEWLTSLNVDQEKIDQAIEDFDKRMNIGKQLLNSLIIGVVLGLISALIVRKKEKVVDSFV